LVAHHGKLDEDLRTFALLGTPLVHSVHNYYPFDLEDGAGWRLWRLNWLNAWLLWWQFIASLTWVLLTLVLCALTVTSVCKISFVELLCSFSAFFGGSATRVHAMSCCCPSWNSGFLSP
jgi:hypothetical protein